MLPTCWKLNEEKSIYSICLQYLKKAFRKRSIFAYSINILFFLFSSLSIYFLQLLHFILLNLSFYSRCSFYFRSKCTFFLVCFLDFRRSLFSSVFFRFVLQFLLSIQFDSPLCGFFFVKMMIPSALWDEKESGWKWKKRKMKCNKYNLHKSESVERSGNEKDCLTEIR